MKTRTRVMSFVLAFAVLLTVTAVGVWTAQISSVATASGPLDMQVTLQEGDPFVFMKNEYKATSESSWQTESTGGDTAMNFSNVSESSLLSGTTWGGSLQDEWEQIPQRVAVPVQRYIVKYKEGEEAQAREMVAPLVSSSQTVQEKVDRFKETASASLTFVNPEMSGTPVDIERLEVLTLQEPMLPSELSQQLEDMGVGSHIRYIQPDFCLSLKDLSLELETTSDFGTTLTEETEVVFGEGTTSFGSIEQTEGSEQAAPVLVALIDTGVDTAHEDLADFLVEGYNATDGTNLIYGVDLPAAYTHGVHVAGLIVDTARETNANVKILPIQAFRNSMAYTSDILAAIAHAEEQGASIVNCSFGSMSDNPALFETIRDSNMLFVCAAGNSRHDMAETPSYPAAYDLPNVIAVASVNNDGGLSYFSNYGTGIVDIAAPGRSVMSTIPENRRGPMTGTSMSSGIVTGTAAAVLSLVQGEDPDFDLAALRLRLLDTADQLSNLQDYISEGRRLNLACALEGENLGGVLDLEPEEDTDEAGYQEDAGEQFSLYSGETNQPTNIVVSATPVYPPQESSVYRYLLIGYITATVYDANNNVLTGQYLTFGVQNGNGSVVVDASTGQILLYFTATSFPSNLVVWAACGSIKGYSSPQSSTVPANLTVSLSSDSLTIPQSGSATTTAVATVRNSSNAVLTGQSISYALVSSYTGVSIDSSTGVVTISPSASAGTVTVRATCGEATNTAAFNLTSSFGAPATLTATITPGTLTIPSSGSSTATAAATVRDINNAVLTGQTVTYSLVTAKTGVSINSSTGIVTVSSTATAGTVTVKGTCGSITGTATLTLTAAVPSSLTVALTPSTVTIQTSGTATSTATATVRDANNNVLTGQTVTYSLTTSKTGVSVNGSSGVVTVSSTATAGTVTVQGTCGSVTGTAVLTLTAIVPSSLTVTLTPSSVTIPTSGTVTSTATATVRDANNNVLTGQTVTYSLPTSKTGVSVNSSTGVVTVSSTATAGTVTVQGTCGSVTGTVTLTLTLTSSAVTMTLQTTANKIYHVSVKGDNVNSFSGTTYTLTYDASKLELQDFAAQTKQSKTTPGVVTGTGLTIVSHSNGVLTFTVQKTISSGYKWSGVLTVLKFKALSTGSSSLQIA